MFATLASGYPRDSLTGGVDRLAEVRDRVARGEADAASARAVEDDLVREVVEELEATGLGFLSDGQVRWDDPVMPIATRLEGFEVGEMTESAETGLRHPRLRARHEPRWDGPITVADWQFAAGLTAMPVKQSIVGPYTLGRLAESGPVSRERLTMALADALAHELRSLVAAGCPLVQVDEPAVGLIGDSPSEQSLFKAAHRRLTNTVRDAHLSLAVMSANLDTVPFRIFFDAPYRSYLVDLVSRPQNWRLVVEAPGERGLIVGIADARSAAPDEADLVRWAGLYAAAVRLRGIDRVGLAPSGSLARLPREAARAKIQVLAGVAAAIHEQAADGGISPNPEGLATEGLAKGYFGQVEGGAMEEARARLAGYETGHT